MTDTGGVLHDDALDSEIALIGELVVAATHSDGPLSQDQIDRLLGVRHDRRERTGSPGR